MGFIYLITNTITGHQYVGQTGLTIEKRWKRHCDCVRRNEHPDLPLYKAIKKYGIENFIVSQIEECDNSLLNEREIYWIKYYDTYYNGYNATIGGEFVRKYDGQEIVDLFLSGKSRKEVAEIIGCSIQAVSYNLNARLDKEYLLKRQYEQQAKTLSKTSPNKRAIAQFDMNNQLIAIYESAKEAERQTGIDHSQIAAVCRGKRRHTHNYIWKYLEDIE